MAKWTAEWLPGAGETGSAGEERSQRWPGDRLGLPETGIGSVAGAGARLLALVIDLTLASLVTSLFFRPDFQNPVVMQSYNLWSVAVWAAVTGVAAALFGFTPGMAVVGIRVGRLDGASMVGVWRALVRAALTFVLIPAMVRNGDGRSWLDRLTGTVVIRMR